jgi:hypothetical protein
LISFFQPAPVGFGATKKNRPVSAGRFDGFWLRQPNARRRLKPK